MPLLSRQGGQTGQVKRQLPGCCHSLGGRQIFPGRQDFPANEPQAEGLRCSRRQFDAHDAGEFAHLLVAGQNRRSGSRSFAVQQETLQGTMHVAARTNPLDNFLAEITALGKVERAHLVRLLRQVAVANIDAIGRDALEHAQLLERIDTAGGRTRSRQGAPQLRYHARFRPDFKPIHQDALCGHDDDGMSAPEFLDQAQRLEVAARKVERSQRFCRFRPSDPNRCPGVARLQRHLIHDDVAPEVRGQLFNLGLIDVEPQGFAFRAAAPVHVQISLDATLRIQHKGVAAGVLLQAFDGVGDHSVEPSHPISTGAAQKATPAEIVHATTGKQSGEFLRSMGEVRGGLCSPIGGERSQRECESRCEGRSRRDHRCGRLDHRFYRVGADFAHRFGGPEPRNGTLKIIAAIRKGLRLLTFPRFRSATAATATQARFRCGRRQAGTVLAAVLAVAQCALALPIQTGGSSAPSSSASGSTHITPEQAKQLFQSVDSILQFDSHDTGLPILHPVHRKLVTRDEVEHYLRQQLHDDRDAKRMERSELVLKKFGLLDRDFQLQPFLIQLLREQIAGYYNEKNNTVNLLDWIPPEEQKPVLAHELTHALQDQHVDLKTWDQQSDLTIAKNVAEDNQHIATDEQDTARDAVLEGQAMVVFIDYALAPTGKTILTAPGVVEKMNDAMSDSSDSPTLASAPLLLQRSLIFPYVDGVNFVRTVLAAKGKQAAFAGMLDRPPSSSYEIMTPQVYMNHDRVPLLRMPDIHPLIDAEYRPYDIGAMGEFDVQVLTELFGGPAASRALTPAWRGGIYYAAQQKDAAKRGTQDSLDSVALLYLSRWATPAAARQFAQVYAQEIPRKYDHAVAQRTPEDAGNHADESTQIWTTGQGPVLLVVSGRSVFLSESFPLDLARKLQLVMLGSIVDSRNSVLVKRESYPSEGPPTHELTEALRQRLFDAGMMRCVLGTPRVSARYTNHFARRSSETVCPTRKCGETPIQQGAN